jgi:hypothetical protein
LRCIKTWNVTEVPYDRKPGQQPALSSAEILDVVAFLKTLDDGYELSPSERRGAEERRPNPLTEFRSRQPMHSKLCRFASYTTMHRS